MCVVGRSPQLPRVGDSELSSHLASLLEEGMLDPTLSDIEIKVCHDCTS